MWRRALVLLVTLSGCATARPGISGPRAEVVAAPDASALVPRLLRDGSVALEAHRWIDAAEALSRAHALAVESQRGEIAFFWAFALFQQGAELARENHEGDRAVVGRARAYFLQARALLEDSDHPLRESLSGEIDRYLLVRLPPASPDPTA